MCSKRLNSSFFTCGTRRTKGWVEVVASRVLRSSPGGPFSSICVTNVVITFMTYHRVGNKSNTTGATCVEMFEFTKVDPLIEEGQTT
jgi:hypothetical protein